MMHALVVSSYPPMPCGIGAYAQQQAEGLRREGRAVNVFSPPEGGGDLRGNLRGGWAPLRLVRWIWAYGEVYIHYTPGFFYDPVNATDRMKTSLAFLILGILAGRRLVFVIHETDYKIEDPLADRGPRFRVDRLAWRLAGRIVLHSERERDAFALRFGFPPDDPRLEVAAHDRYFVSRFAGGREEARRRFGLPGGKTVFLCIGFVQPHKGFDRAIRALREVEDPDALLRIVGSVRIAWEPALEFARLLRRECSADPRAQFVERFVDDEEFDAWIVASDYVICPYHEIWSSGVAARARLHGRPAIVSDAGALAEQMPEGSFAFKTEAELAEAMRKALGAASLRRLQTPGS